MHVGQGVYVGLNAIGEGLTNVAVVASARVAREAAHDPNRFWLSMIERFPALRERIHPDGIVRAVMATGPFATWSRHVVADGALLVGDAADFFDPFTGEGIRSALRGGEMASTALIEALSRSPTVRSTDLAGYRVARRRAFRGKWAVERMIGYGMLAPRLFDRAVGRLDRKGMGHTLVGVTGEILPARAVLNPTFLMSMVV
jgi:flavin-dependent dehydrogenase